MSLRKILTTLVALAAAATGVFVAVRRRSSPDRAVPTPPSPAPSQEPAKKVVDEQVACPNCGFKLRASGEGRHRVLWPADGSISDPLLEPVCPECETSLAEV